MRERAARGPLVLAGVALAGVLAGAVGSAFLVTAVFVGSAEDIGREIGAGLGPEIGRATGEGVARAMEDAAGSLLESGIIGEEFGAWGSGPYGGTVEQYPAVEPGARPRPRPEPVRRRAPTATGLSPSSGPAAGGTPVTLTGTNFVPGGTDIVVAFTSGGQATIPASDVRVDSTGTAASFTTVAHPRAAGGPAGFFPRTAAGRSATPQVFTYVPATPPPLPTATGLSPSSGPVAGGTPVTLTGHQLRAGRH